MSLPQVLWLFRGKPKHPQLTFKISDQVLFEVEVNEAGGGAGKELGTGMTYRLSFMREIRIGRNPCGYWEPFQQNPLHEPPSAFGLCTPIVEITHAYSRVHLRRRGCSHGLLWVNLPARCYSVLSLPSHRQVCAPRLMIHDWERRKTIYHLLMKIMQHHSEPAAPMQYFLLLPSLEGRGPPTRALWACLCLLTSLPFSPLTHGMYLFARGAFSETRVRLSHKPPWDPDLLINHLCWLWLISLQLVGNLVAALSVALLT